MYCIKKASSLFQSHFFQLLSQSHKSMYCMATYMTKGRYWLSGISSPWMHSLLVNVKWNYMTVSEEATTDVCARGCALAANPPLVKHL